MFSIIIAPKAKKQLLKLEKKEIENILRKLNEIREDPLHFIERLKGLPSWKLRIGDYRAIMNIDTGKKEIYIEKIGHRRDIYTKLS